MDWQPDHSWRRTSRHEKGRLMSSTILMNITHGFQARMLLRSRICDDLLSGGARIVVVSPNADEGYFQREMGRPGVSLEMMPNSVSRLESELVGLRQYLLMNPALGATLNHKNETFRNRHPWRAGAARVGNAILGRVPPLRNGYLRLERHVFSGKDYEQVLDRYRPSLVVTGTPGYNTQDMHLLRAARRCAVTTATVMLSWDNLTSKGYMGAMPDFLLVWSDLMAEEGARYHGFPVERIVRVGAAQFDHYCGFRQRFDRNAWRMAQGLSPGTPLIVYGTINPAILPHEPQVVSSILRALRHAPLPVHPHLWVRLHPQVVHGDFSTQIEAYRAMASEDVTIEVPKVQSKKLAWDLPAEDADHLASLLAAADVVVTTSSTLVIDSACAGTPIVNVLFDGDEPVPAGLAAERFAHYTHYAQILQTGGIALGRTPEELMTRLAEYLQNPRKDQEGRERIITQQLGLLDGKAGHRTANALLRMAAGARDGM